MSKTVNTIAIAIISEMLYGLYASFSSRWSVVFFILAALGGEIAFFGLWIEKEADKAEKKEHLSNFLDEARRIKLKSKIGWWILMIGIGFEVLTATGLAIRDDWEIRNANANALKNDPNKWQIFHVLGYAELSVHPLEPIWNTVNWRTNSNGDKFEPLPHFGAITLPSPDKYEVELVLGKSLQLETNGWNLQIGSDRVSSLPTITWLGAMTHENSISLKVYFGSSPEKTQISSSLLTPEDLDAVSLTLPFRCEILQGDVKMIINGSIPKNFQIPPQTTIGDVATSVMTTNGDFEPLNLHPNN